MNRRFIRLALLLAGILLLAVGAVSAHEGREVGDYDIHFGWRGEPAYAGQLNGPEIYIASLSDDDTAALEGLDVNLRAEVTFGDQTTTVTFRPAWGEVGHYIADLTPTLPGDYVFHVTGNIGDTQVDAIFTSADGQFSTVEPTTDLMFPSARSMEARIADLEARVRALEAAVAELQGQ